MYVMCSPGTLYYGRLCVDTQDYMYTYTTQIQYVYKVFAKIKKS